MILSEKVNRALAFIQEIEVPENLEPWQAGRAFYENFIPLAGKKQDVFQIEERTILNGKQKIRLRIYRPDAAEKLPVIVYLHGGWFNAGSLETHDTPLRQLTNLAGATIIAVDYRLAPENPFPAGLNDCAFALQWIMDQASSLQVNPDNIFIAGDSAGAALAATLSRKFRAKIRAQLLIYPVTDNSLKTNSWAAFQNGPLLHLNGAIQAWDWYLTTTDDRKNPDAVPLLANDLEALPPTFIAVAEYDPLKDEAIQYAEKLQAGRVAVHLKLYKGMIHGFFQMGKYIDDAVILMLDMVDFIKRNKI